MILKPYEAIIEKLLTIKDDPNFDLIFIRLLTKEKESIRFLIKMELYRLAQPCPRNIDLRNKSELVCEPIDVAGQQHFLDENTRNVLLETMGLYHDSFTIGVFEKAMQTHQDLHRQLEVKQVYSTNDDQPFIVPSVMLGECFNHKNDQINFNLKVLVFQKDKPEVKGIVSELSFNSAILFLPIDHHLDLTKTLAIRFVNIDSGIERKLAGEVEYKIFNYKQNKKHIALRVKRLTSGKQISEALYQLERKCKKANQIDFSEDYNVICGLALERLYLSHYLHLAVFVAEEKTKYQIKYLLKSQKNNKIFDYFLDENKQNQLESLLTSNRITKILQEPDNKDNQLIYCFNHKVKGQLLFYSATLSELKKNNNLGLFFNFGSRKRSWRVFRIKGNKINHPRSYKHSVFPGASDKFNLKTEKELSALTHVLQIMDYSDEQAKVCYQNWQSEGGGEVNALNNYGQEKVVRASSQLLIMQFFNRIQEERYKLQTLVKLTQGKLEVESISQDISSKGFQVTLDNFVQFDPDELVNISLPRLQKISPNRELKDWPYRIVNVRDNGMILHLMAHMGEKSEHMGVEFMKEIISANKQKLVLASEEESELKQLTDGTKNLLLKQLVGMPFFIEKTAKSACLSFVGITEKPADINRLFSIKGSEPLTFNFESLFENGRKDFEEQLLFEIKMQDENMPMTWYGIFVKVDKANSSLQCKLMDRFGDYQAQLNFIKEAKKEGDFYALRVYRGGAPKPDFTHIEKELKYLTHYDEKASNSFRQKMKLIIGVGEILNITSEIEMRFPELWNESLNVKQNVKPIHKNPQPPLKDLVEADKDNSDTDQNQAVTQDVNANNS